MTPNHPSSLVLGSVDRSPKPPDSISHVTSNAYRHCTFWCNVSLTTCLPRRFSSSCLGESSLPSLQDIHTDRSTAFRLLKTSAGSLKEKVLLESLQGSPKPKVPVWTESDTPQSQMCRIEQFDVVYPDRTRERREQIVPCRLGTRSQPCRYTELVSLEDRPASDLRPRIQPHIVPLEPQGIGSSQLRPSERMRPRDPMEGLALHIKFWNPFCPKTKEKKEKPKYYFVRKTRKPEPHPFLMQHQQPIPPPHEMDITTPVRGEPPVVIPIQPPENHASHHLPEREPRRRRRRPNPIVIHYPSEEDENESSSPPQANREHRRRVRSLSPISRYEAEKAIRERELRERELRERELRERELRERELREREHRERIQREARRARARAERIANQERLGRQREREEQERIRQERRESWQRRQQEERDREDRLRDEQARWRYVEQQRLARARQANLPRPPRHPVFVHEYEDRGERFIQDAIRAENLRLFERTARWSRGGYE